MTNTTKRLIGIGERPWAARREFQRFLGVYVLDRQAGIYIDQDVSDLDKKLISATFRRIPPAMRRLCRQYEVTFSTCVGCTASGNSSTFYGDFTSSRARISPHIEMSRASLAPDVVLAHMTHEAAHLWWRTLPAGARQDYVQFLRATCPPDSIEVTAYAHDHFRNALETATDEGTETCSECRRRRCRELWLEESFCETVAVLHVPTYGGRRQDSTVDLPARRRAIHEIARLPVG